MEKGSLLRVCAAKILTQTNQPSIKPYQIGECFGQDTVLQIFKGYLETKEKWDHFRVIKYAANFLLWSHGPRLGNTEKNVTRIKVSSFTNCLSLNSLWKSVFEENFYWLLGVKQSLALSVVQTHGIWTLPSDCSIFDTSSRTVISISSKWALE